MPEQKEALAVAHLEGADDFGERALRPDEQATACGKFEREELFGRAGLGTDFLQSDGRDVGARRRREDGGAKFAVEKTSHGARVLIEEMHIGAAAPELAHRKYKGIERDEHERDEREREEDFQQRKCAARCAMAGSPLKGRG